MKKKRYAVAERLKTRISLAESRKFHSWTKALCSYQNKIIRALRQGKK